MTHNDESVDSREWFLLAAIATAALIIRLTRIGHLSFSGDEEMTALATLALLDGWPPMLPGGLNYVRSLPFTFIEAATVSVFGINEAAFRLVPALVVVPRLAFLWAFARPFVGRPLALGAAAVLAIAPLDVELSRTARMYSLFGTLDLAFLAAVVATSRGRKMVFGSVIAGCAAVATHMLAVFHSPVPILASLGRGLRRSQRVALASIGVAVAASFWVVRVHKSYMYGSTPVRLPSLEDGPGLLAAHFGRVAAVADTQLAVLTLALGSGVAIVFLLRATRSMGSHTGRALGLLSGIATLVGSPVAGCAILAAALIVEGSRQGDLGLKLRWLALGTGVGTAAWATALLVGQRALGPGAIRFALEHLVNYPAPNWYEFLEAAPFFCLLALIGIFVAVRRGAKSDASAMWLALIAAAILPFILSGLFKRVGATRYQFHALGPLIVLALLGTQTLMRRWPRRSAAVAAVCVLIVGLSVRPDQTYRTVMRDHGPADLPFSVVPGVSPDHRSAGQFVRSYAQRDELIVAEDSLQMMYYAGRVDFWLRESRDARRYLRADPDGGRPRDQYTGARHLSSIEEVQTLSREAGRRGVWLVTSGEAEVRPRWYRTPATRHYLRKWESLAWYVAGDGLTRVLRLENGEPVPPPLSGVR